MIGDDAVAVGSLVLVVLAPGLVLIAALRARWLSRLDRPLDGGRTLGGAPTLGESKSWRGLLIYVVGGTLVSAAFALAPDAWSSPLFQSRSPLVIGVAVGLAYTLGEAINSFIKRRVGIAAGTTTASRGRWVQRPADLADGIVLVVLAYGLLGVPWATAIATGVAGIAVHVLTDVLMRALRLKHQQ
jgi:hypothetical protein